MKKISGDKVKELAAIDEQFFGIDKERDVAKSVRFPTGHFR